MYIIITYLFAFQYNAKLQTIYFEEKNFVLDFKISVECYFFNTSVSTWNVTIL